MRVWHRGEIVDSSRVSVPLEDAVFEHGLGLFETLRTFQGRAVFLEEHLQRMTNSARVLSLPRVDSVAMPEERDVAQLLRDLGLRDAILRITRTAGAEGTAPMVWMRAAPLPPTSTPSYSVVACPWTIEPEDPLARHKTLNYWQRRLAFASAHTKGYHEAFLHDSDSIIWEGSRTNVFAVIGDRLVTPPQLGPIVPGIMRQAVINFARGVVDMKERVLHWRELANATEIFLTNSVRGVLPVAKVEGPTRWTVPGETPITEELQRRLAQFVRGS